MNAVEARMHAAYGNQFMVIAESKIKLDMMTAFKFHFFGMHRIFLIFSKPTIVS
jgi:hypothetical protein